MPSITRLKMGKPYVVTNFQYIVSMDLIPQRFPSDNMSPRNQCQAKDLFLRQGVLRQRVEPADETLIVPVSKAPLTLDGMFSNWTPKAICADYERRRAPKKMSPTRRR